MTDEEFENEVYFRRLEEGLFTLQLIDYIILEVCTNGPTSIKQRVTKILNLRGGSLKTIRQIMRGNSVILYLKSYIILHYILIDFYLFRKYKKLEIKFSYTILCICHINI